MIGIIIISSLLVIESGLLILAGIQNLKLNKEKEALLEKLAIVEGQLINLQTSDNPQKRNYRRGNRNTKKASN